ncbi:MAG: hypothetical protein AAGA08_01695 [Pseudomonadota bacterium]
MIAILRAVSQSPKQISAGLIFWIISVFYTYGALVHILNMLSLNGFDWGEAPAKWKGLDVAFLILDVTVVVGLLRGARIGIGAFFGAALSQIALYTVFRDWVLDVPDAFRRSAEEIAYLDGLVIFHLVTCIAMSFAI